MAVLNHNTTYHATLGCEPTRVFHGRIPHYILDFKLGYNPNPRFQPQTEVAEEVQRRIALLHDQTKKNIMQSYLKYKAYNDRKAKASPLTTENYCFILNLKADTQATKIPFREFRWVGPYRVEKVLPNKNYFVRRLGTNETQLLHRIRLYEVQRRIALLHDQTKKNIMQSYLKYKAYYDRKAKASPLTTENYCFILNLKADTQATKIPFREFRWVGPYKVEKVLPNNNYIVRRLGTNKTQLLHRIRLRKYTPQAPLADNFVRETDWQKEDTLISQDDLYAHAWDSNFGSSPFDPDHENCDQQEDT